MDLQEKVGYWAANPFLEQRLLFGRREVPAGSEGRVLSPVTSGHGDRLCYRGKRQPGAGGEKFQLTMQQAAQQAQMTFPVKAGELIKQCG